MKLSTFKEQLKSSSDISFLLPNGRRIPQHFHITEIGLINKDFIDCGGTVRNEKVANFQVWEANDFDHRLTPEKLLSIIAQSDKVLAGQDPEIEIEYQQETIGKFGLAFNGKEYALTAKQTACLATDSCGVPPEKQKVKLESLNNEEASCTPGGGCC